MTEEIVPPNVLLIDVDKVTTTEQVQVINKVCRSMGVRGGLIVVALFNERKMSYLSGYRTLHQFGDEYSAEEPKTFRTYRNALAACDRTNIEYDGSPTFVGACLAFWVHPDSGNPLEYYLRVSGFRYPGSPTQ